MKSRERLGEKHEKERTCRIAGSGADTGAGCLWRNGRRRRTPPRTRRWRKLRRPRRKRLRKPMGEDGVPVTIEGPETADDSPAAPGGRAGSGLPPRGPGEGAGDGEPSGRPGGEAGIPAGGGHKAPAAGQGAGDAGPARPSPSSGVCFRRGSGGFLRFRDRGPGDVARPDGRGG